MYYAICYVSNANNLLDFEIRELMEHSAGRNLKRSISGILLNNGGNFFQYMEGDVHVIKELFYKNIKEDSRHKNTIVVLEKEIDHLYFEGYETGFTAILEEQDKVKLRSYLKLLQELASNEVAPVTKTIETFLGKSLN